MIRTLSIIPALLLALVTMISIAEETPTDKPGVAAAGLVQVSAIVEAVDLKTRTVTLRGEDGKVTTLQVSKEARNLDQVEVGDVLEAEYYESVTIVVQDAAGDFTPEAKVATARTPKGDKPGMAMAETVIINPLGQGITLRAFQRDNTRVVVDGLDHRLDDNGFRHGHAGLVTLWRPGSR